MMTFSTLKSFVLLCFFKFGKAVPIDYCLQPLNKSDCGVNPTSVFSYYKPGSRCEIELWRGCPTANKFPDEYLCSHHCIGKLFGGTDDDIQSLDFVDSESAEEELNECNLIINEKDCGIEAHKYTFRDNQCVLVVWKGCTSQNLFDDEESCIEACSPTQNLEDPSDFEDELKTLPLEEVQEIIQILDKILVDSTTKPSIVTLNTLPVETTSAFAETSQTPTTEQDTKATTEVPTTPSPTVANISTLDDSTTEISTTKEVITEATIAVTTTEAAIETLGTTETTMTKTMTKQHQQVTTPDDSSGSVDEVIVT